MNRGSFIRMLLFFKNKYMLNFFFVELCYMVWGLKKFNLFMIIGVGYSCFFLIELKDLFCFFFF